VANVCDWYDARRRFNAAMREVFLGFDAIRFERGSDGVAMALGTRDGSMTPCATLSNEALLTLARLAVLCSPEPPPLLWIDRPDEGVLPWALPTLATCCLEAARHTQLVLSHPSPRFEAFLRLLARSPGHTARRSPLRVNFTEC
jgi:predicted ATPase